MSDVTDGTRIGVELMLPAGVRAGPAFAAHGNEPDALACANALNELVEYVRPLVMPALPPGDIAPVPVSGPAAPISKFTPRLLRLMKGRLATEEGSKRGMRVGSETAFEG